MKNPKKTNAEGHKVSSESFDADLERFMRESAGSNTQKIMFVRKLKERLDEETVKYEVANKLGQAVTGRFYEYWEACQKLQAELKEVREELSVARLMSSVVGVFRNRK